MSGILSGSLISFTLSRYLFKDSVRNQINSVTWMAQNFNAIDELLINQGITIVSLIRLTFAPFGVVNYVLGCTSISLFSFMGGTCMYTFNCGMQIFIGCSFYSI
jgi:uncharacterized membrane protein YdjX (TVP38/TMEM64 family)